MRNCAIAWLMVIQLTGNQINLNQPASERGRSACTVKASPGRKYGSLKKSPSKNVWGREQ
jgi:hypothetical protein